jgi:hypothetical protein
MKQAAVLLIALLWATAQETQSLDLVIDEPPETVWLPRPHGRDRPALDLRFRAFARGNDDPTRWRIGVWAGRESKELNAVVEFKDVLPSSCALLRPGSSNDAEQVYECYANWPVQVSPQDDGDDGPVERAVFGSWKIVIMAIKGAERVGATAVVEVLDEASLGARRLCRAGDEQNEPGWPGGNQASSMSGNAVCEDGSTERIARRLPKCWHSGLPLSRQAPSCLWLWRTTMTGARKVMFYTREEYMLATETFEVAAAHHARITQVLSALPSRAQLSVHPAAAALGSCAVVGNSWILGEAEHGAEIDGP